MSALRLGSLFSGFGGLDLAIENVFGAETVWVSDIEPGPCKVLAYRFPHAPNLGDITKVDWSTVEPVDIIAGGSPCQDISSAGRMAGMREGTRSNLWVEMREAIATIRPRYVVWENVGAARSTAAASAMESDPRLLGDHPAGQPVLRALGRVLGDLASLGYDTQWHSLRAADVGAPHGRLRFFVLAADTSGGGRREAVADLRQGQPDPNRSLASDADRAGRIEHGGAVAVSSQQPAPERGGGDAGLTLLPTPSANLGINGGSQDPAKRRAGGHSVQLHDVVEHLPTPRATRGGSTTEIAYALGGERSNDDRTQGCVLLPTPHAGMADRGASDPDLRKARNPKHSPQLDELAVVDRFGPYAAAIARWEAVTRPAPSSTKAGRNGRPKLNPEFAAWMMGTPAGWITDVPGVTDNEALRMAGNGVVQQQAESALRLMLTRMARFAA